MNPSPLPFDELREFFDPSEYGDLCDIHAPDATSREWGVFLKKVVPQYPYDFTLVTEDGEVTHQPLPEDPRGLLNPARFEHGPWPGLTFQLPGFAMRVLFLSPDWLEVDCSRYEVTPHRYIAIADLMRRMGDAMEVDNFLTPESRQEEAAMVYEVGERRFRAPRHGIGSDGILRRSMFTSLARAVQPIRSEAEEPLALAHESDPTLPDHVLKSILIEVEDITRLHRELTLQDELTIEERWMLQSLWSTLATIVRPAPGSGAEQYRSDYWRDLLRLVRQLTL